jgi:hypothetical protein
MHIMVIKQRAKFLWGVWAPGLCALCASSWLILLVCDLILNLLPAVVPLGD